MDLLVQPGRWPWKSEASNDLASYVRIPTTQTTYTTKHGGEDARETPWLSLHPFACSGKKSVDSRLMTMLTLSPSTHLP